MNPFDVPEWLKQYGPIGGILWLIYTSVRTRTPDKPPADNTDLVARVAHLETDVAVLKAIQEERK